MLVYYVVFEYPFIFHLSSVQFQPVCNLSHLNVILFISMSLNMSHFVSFSKESCYWLEVIMVRHVFQCGVAGDSHSQRPGTNSGPRACQHSAGMFSSPGWWASASAPLQPPPHLKNIQVMLIECSVLPQGVSVYVYPAFRKPPCPKAMLEATSLTLTLTPFPFPNPDQAKRTNRFFFFIIFD